MAKGWHGDKYKHKLASKGVKSRKDGYRYGGEFVPETPEERRQRRIQTVKEMHEFGTEDPDSLFFDETSLEAEGVLTEEELHQKQVEMGVEVESEHVNTFIQIIEDARAGKLKPLEFYQKMVAEEHIEEVKDYYTRLEQMESEAGVQVSE